jgi:hypothetical protein
MPFGTGDSLKTLGRRWRIFSIKRGSVEKNKEASKIIE